MAGSFHSPFSRKLKKLRIESGKSQERLARELDISRSCLANYETGKREPDNAMLIKMADVFGILTDYLLDRSGFRNLEFSEEEIAEFDALRDAVANSSPLLNVVPLSAGKQKVLRAFCEQMRKREAKKPETVAG